MTQIATVEKLLPGGYAKISVPRKSACGHDCEECAGCGMTGAAIKARAKNDPNAQPGEKVVVESSTRKLLGVVALVYVLPVLCFLLGYFLSEGLAECWRYGIAIAAAALAEELSGSGKRVWILGDGWAICEKALKERGVECTVAPEELRWQTAFGVCLAAQNKTPTGAEDLLPVYLRLSQAERERQSRMSEA